MLTYIDGGSGVAGDMLLGALVGLGVQPRELEHTLQAALKVKSWRLHVSQIERRRWPAWSVHVVGDRPYGSLEKMRGCVRHAGLPSEVKQKAAQALQTLEQAERQAHGTSRSSIDSHGLGLLDTLIDVVGCAWGFWKLNIREVMASPLQTGRIAPATAVMLQQRRIPVFAGTTARELATPTGVAVLSTIATAYQPMPELRLEKTGYGAGTQDLSGHPNVLAIYRGEPVAPALPYNQETVVCLETVIDDMDPRLYPHVTDLLFKRGALDVWWSAVGMKKGRPGIAFSVLCPPALEPRLMHILFQETTTLGVRRLPVQRWVLPRKEQGLRKIAFLPGGARKRQTEFEVARKRSESRAVPLVKLLK